MSSIADVNAALGADKMVDELRRMVSAFDNGLLRVNSKFVTLNRSTTVFEYVLETTEGRESVRAQLKITRPYRRAATV
jgi:hypothetical protein